MNIRERLESHAAACRDARSRGVARPLLPHDLRDELIAMVKRGERARLDGARLDGASLDGASLDGAILDGASLDGASLFGAIGLPALLDGKCDLPETAEQRAERLRQRADRRAARAAEFRASRPDVPVVTDIDSAILAAVSADGCSLDMRSWHVCETTHCRAGWAITLAGEAGKLLESRIGTASAGALIYLASAGYMPNFYATNDEAMADLREGAGVQS